MDKESGGWTESQEDGQTFRRMDRQSGGWTDSREDGQTVRRNVQTVRRMDRKS